MAFSKILEQRKAELVNQLVESRQHQILTSRVQELLPIVDKQKQQVEQFIEKTIRTQEEEKKKQIEAEAAAKAAPSPNLPWYYQSANFYTLAALYWIALNSLSYYLYPIAIPLGVIFHVVTLLPIVFFHVRIKKLVQSQYVEKKVHQVKHLPNVLKNYDIVLMQFSKLPTPMFSMDYYCTFVSDHKKELIQMWNMDKDKYGSLKGATFIGFRQKEHLNTKRQVVLLIQLEDGHFKMEPIEVNPSSLSVIKEIQSPLLKYLERHSKDIINAITPLTSAINDWNSSNQAAKDNQAALEKVERQIECAKDIPLSEDNMHRVITLLEEFEKAPAASPRGIILHGPTGTGKSSMPAQFSKLIGLRYMATSADKLKDPQKGQTAQNVKELWAKIRVLAPCVVLVDDCEQIFGHGMDVAEDDYMMQELQTAFLNEWDELSKQPGQVFIVATTGDLHEIEPSVVLRFNDTLEVALPDFDIRYAVLQQAIKEHNLQVELTKTMVELTSGMNLRSLHNVVMRLKIYPNITEELFEELVESVRSNVSTKTQHVTWDQVILNQHQKQKLVYLAQKIKKAEQYLKKGLPISKSLLLYGPPGTGKTQIARALATESGLAFLAAATSDIKNAEPGKSSKYIHMLFEKARTQSPCLLFIDEMDIVASTRDVNNTLGQEIVGQFLQEMDGIGSRNTAGQVFVIGATNNRDAIDPAVLSRFAEQEEVGLPEFDRRRDIIKLNFSTKPIAFDLEDIATRLAEQTEGFSGRDLHGLVNQIASNAMQRADALQLDVDSIEISLDDFSHMEVNGKKITI